MSQLNNFSDQNYLIKRVEFLEQEVKWYCEAFELIGSTTEMYSAVHDQRDMKGIFLLTKQYLDYFIPFDAIGFFLVNEKDSSLYLHSVFDAHHSATEPVDHLQESYELIKREMDFQIDTGECAWAMRQTKPFLPKSSISGRHVLLHSITTPTRVRGMMLGFLKNNFQITKPLALYMSVVLAHSAHAINSVEFFHVINLQNEMLEQLLAKRSQEMEKLHLYDQTTSLPNRAALMGYLEQLFYYSTNDRTRTALVLIDIDDFKRIGESFGNNIAEMALRDVAQHLNETLQNHQEENKAPLKTKGYNAAKLFNIGGDEFAIVFEQISDTSAVLQVVNEAHRSLKHEFYVQSHNIHLTMSSGIAYFPDDGIDKESLLKNAETAMHKAKNAGKDCFSLYKHAESISLHSLTIEAELKKAIENQEFVLHYQPKARCNDLTPVGFEALVRWQHPEKGLLSPAHFIRIAEDTGLIVPIGELIFHIACKDIKNWIKEGFNPLPVTINISALQFRRERIADIILKICNSYNIMPNLIEAELTESAIMHDVKRAVRSLLDLQNAGIKLFVDDFGTGYSSMSYLQQLPLTGLKIDQSFVRDITYNQNSLAIVKAIIALAHSLNMTTVAEGIEFEDQLNIIRTMGCDTMQGFFYSKPTPSDKAKNFLKSL